MRVNLDGYHYPPLAASAHIQGDVTFEVSAAGQGLVSGHPLLVRSAQDNLKTWSLPPLQSGKYLINYHFQVIGEGVTAEKMVPIGNKFERFFFHLVRAPTKKVIRVCSSDLMLTAPPRHTMVQEGDGIVIDVFVAGLARCIQTEASQVTLASHL